MKSAFALLAIVAAIAPPNIVVNDESAIAVKQNRLELVTATGQANLPSGKVSVDECPVLTFPNAGLLMAGNRTIIASDNPAGNWVTGRALAVRPGLGGDKVLSFYELPPTQPLPAGQVGWLFDPGGVGGEFFYPKPNVRVLPGQPIPAAGLPNFTRAYKATAFNGAIAGFRAFAVQRGHGFAVGDEIFATDGPYINEVVPGEFRKIVALGGSGGDAIWLDAPLTKAYKQGTFVGGPIPRRQTFQGLRFHSATWGPVLVQQAVDVSFNDCTFDRAREWVSVIGSGRVTFTNCIMPSGFMSSSSTDVRFRNCAIREVQGEQCANDFKFDGCRIGPDRFDSKVQCLNWQLSECVTDGDLFIYDGWTVRDHVAYGQVVIRGRGAIVRNLWSAQSIVVQGLYHGSPPQGATGILLDGVVAPTIHLLPGTSGTIRNRKCPVTGDLSGWLITPPQ